MRQSDHTVAIGAVIVAVVAIFAGMAVALEAVHSSNTIMLLGSIIGVPAILAPVLINLFRTSETRQDVKETRREVVSINEGVKVVGKALNGDMDRRFDDQEGRLRSLIDEQNQKFTEMFKASGILPEDWDGTERRQGLRREQDRIAYEALEKQKGNE